MSSGSAARPAARCCEAGAVGAESHDRAAAPSTAQLAPHLDPTPQPNSNIADGRTGRNVMLLPSAVQQRRNDHGVWPQPPPPPPPPPAHRNPAAALATAVPSSSAGAGDNALAAAASPPTAAAAGGSPAGAAGAAAAGSRPEARLRFELPSTNPDVQTAALFNDSLEPPVGRRGPACQH